MTRLVRARAVPALFAVGLLLSACQDVPPAGDGDRATLGTSGTAAPDGPATTPDGQAPGVEDPMPSDGGGAPAPSPMGDMRMVAVDVSGGLPEGAAGSGEELLRDDNPDVRPSTDGVAQFRIHCDFSHMNFDDPLVHPGEPDASHLHAFFGNTDVDAMSTAESIATSGNSTCNGGTVNRSGYWVPAMIDTATGAPVPPSRSTFYYKSGYGGIDPADVRSLPEGLRIIAGDARATTAGENEGASWNCLAEGEQWRGGDPTASGTIPTDCETGDHLVKRVSFPACWDGRNLDAADHRSHMAYARNGCPDSHPVALPTITFNIRYEVTDAAAVANWRLASDTVDGEPGASLHGDWWNGWDPEVFERVIDTCYRPAIDCVIDRLGDGTRLDAP